MDEEALLARRGIEEEYKILQAKWDDFDRRALTIRGWFLAGSAAAMGISYNTRSITFSVFILIITLTIWITEAIWKSWQHAYGARIMLIESYFRKDENFRLDPYQIHNAWSKSYCVRPGFSVNWRKVFQEAASGYIVVAYMPIALTFVLTSIWFLFLKIYR